MGFVVIGVVEISDGPTVGNNNVIISPVFAQDTNQELLVGAARLTFKAVVGTHHLFYFSFRHQGFEGGQIGFPQIALRDILGVETMPVPFRTAMYGVMLGTGMGFIIFSGTVALQAFYHGQSHERGQIRVFPVCFHTASPSRVTVDIDVRSPESQSFVTTPLAFTLEVMAFGTGFIGYNVEGFINSLIVEGGGKTYGLRKDGGLSGTCHSVQCFIPPVIRRYSEAFDSR